MASRAARSSSGSIRGSQLVRSMSSWEGPSISRTPRRRIGPSASTTSASWPCESTRTELRGAVRQAELRKSVIDGEAQGRLVGDYVVKHRLRQLDDRSEE